MLLTFYEGGADAKSFESKVVIFHYLHVSYITRGGPAEIELNLIVTAKEGGQAARIYTKIGVAAQRVNIDILITTFMSDHRPTVRRQETNYVKTGNHFFLVEALSWWLCIAVRTNVMLSKPSSKSSSFLLITSLHLPKS